MKIIAQWLENKEYWEGVKIYERLGSNGFLKQIFQNKNEYTEKKLREELAAIQTEGCNETTERTVTAIPPSDHLFIRKKLERELQQVYRAIDNNRFQLSRATNDRIRREYAFQVLRLQSKKANFYMQLNHLEQHGILPVKKEKKSFITPEIQRLHVQISKAKTRLRQSPDKIRNRAKTEQLLSDKQAKLKELTEERRRLK